MPLKVLQIMERELTWGIARWRFTKAKRQNGLLFVAQSPWGLRLSLPERPCCREVMLREDLRLSLPERPCCREVMLQVAEEPRQKLWIEVERRFLIPLDLIWHESKFD